MYHMVLHIQVNKVHFSFNVLSCNSLCVFFLASTSELLWILTSSKDNLEDSHFFAVVWKSPRYVPD